MNCFAGLAQLVEHLTCNHVVASSILAPGSIAVSFDVARRLLPNGERRHQQRQPARTLAHHLLRMQEAVQF